MPCEQPEHDTDRNSDVVYVCVDALRFDKLTLDLETARRVNARQALTMATVGHDLRQNVQTILLSLDLVKSALHGADQLGWLAVAGEQAKVLIDGLEQLALEANMAAYANQRERSSFPIGEVLARIESKWRHAAAAKHLCFRIDRISALIRSNVGLLTTVIDNLVSNAIKHTERGSVGIALASVGHELLISVQDTGPGISSDEMETIFDPCWRGSGAKPGMGLGLAIVQSTASLLDHRISVNSRVGRGSCFTVHVPLATSFASRKSRVVEAENDLPEPAANIRSIVPRGSTLVGER